MDHVLCGMRGPHDDVATINNNPGAAEHVWIAAQG